MGKKWTKFLNTITFGALEKSAKKKAEKLANEKNNELKLNTMQLPDVDSIIIALGKKDNILKISTTISTIKFELKDALNVDLELIKKICQKGAIKNYNSIVITIGDCAAELKKQIEEKMKI